MSDCVLSLIHPNAVPEAWDAMAPFIEEACATCNGRYASEHIRHWAEIGDWQLWVVSDRDEVLSVTGTQIISYPTGLKSIAIRLCDGKERERWQHFLDDILTWGKGQGCTLREGMFRIGWRRVLKDWTHTHEFMEGSL